MSLQLGCSSSAWTDASIVTSPSRSIEKRELPKCMLEEVGVWARFSLSHPTTRRENLESRSLTRRGRSYQLVLSLRVVESCTMAEETHRPWKESQQVWKACSNQTTDCLDRMVASCKRMEAMLREMVKNQEILKGMVLHGTRTKVHKPQEEVKTTNQETLENEVAEPVQKDESQDNVEVEKGEPTGKKEDFSVVKENNYHHEVGKMRVQEWWKEEDEHRESNHPLTATLFEEEREQTNPLEKTSTAAPEPKEPFQNQILELFFFQFIEWARNTGYLDFCFLLSQSLNSIDYRKIFIWDPGGSGGGGGGSNGGNGGGCCDTSLKSSCKWRLDNQHHSYNKFFSSGFVFFFGCFVLFGSIATVYGWFAFSPSVSTVLSTFGCQEDNEGSWSVGI